MKRKHQDRITKLEYAVASLEEKVAELKSTWLLAYKHAGATQSTATPAKKATKRRAD